jgi:hypothetical protein
MPVKTKNVFATPEDSDGERYLITRHYAALPKSMKRTLLLSGSET